MLDNTMFTIEKEGELLTVVRDDAAENPREWCDMLGTMICFHRRYRLGDKHNYESPEDFNSKDFVVTIPLYLYDHSGITIATHPFSCSWDSGQVGWIGATRERIKEQLGITKITKKVIDRVKEILEAEVKEYDDFLQGNAYGFSVEELQKCECCGNVSKEIIDSCYGFLGDLKSNGMLDSIPEKFREDFLTHV